MKYRSHCQSDLKEKMGQIILFSSYSLIASWIISHVTAIETLISVLGKTKSQLVDNIKKMNLLWLNLLRDLSDWSRFLQVRIVDGVEIILGPVLNHLFRISSQTSHSRSNWTPFWSLCCHPVSECRNSNVMRNNKTCAFTLSPYILYL